MMSVMTLMNVLKVSAMILPIASIQLARSIACVEKI